MRRFPHGIWRSFLAACGGSLFTCLPLLPFDGVEHLQQQQPQVGQNNGEGIPPSQGNAPAENCDLLQPAHSDEEVGTQKFADNYDLQQQKKGDLPPMRGEASNPADNHDVLLQPMHCDDGYCPSQNAENFNLQSKGGSLQPISGVEAEDIVNIDLQLQGGQNDGSLPPARGDENKTAVNSAMQYLQGEEIGLLLPLSGEDEGVLPPMKGDKDGSITEQGQHKINAWLMPSSRPRVKMKAEIQLLYIHDHRSARSGHTGGLYECSCMGT